jgi:hypothetical protein
MPRAYRSDHTDMMRRLDDLPLSEHDRQAAKAQAALAFGLVDTICDAVDAFQSLFAPARRHAPR